MKLMLIASLAATSLLSVDRSFAEEKKSDGANSKDIPIESNKQNSKPSVEELENKFKATLTKATMSGRWCSIKDGVLGPEKEDKYTIIGVTKLGGDVWTINARIQYGNKDIVAPIPVQLKWAGDTPVLIIDKVPVPGGGVYSARVLIYGQAYAGSWTGGDHAGLLNGIITNEKD
jgi:hypothetical protein